MLWISLTLVLITMVALRYGADSRDGQDRNPFAPPGCTAPDTPSTPAGGYRRAHTPRDDLAALAAIARAVLHRSGEGTCGQDGRLHAVLGRATRGRPG